MNNLSALKSFKYIIIAVYILVVTIHCRYSIASDNLEIMKIRDEALKYWEKYIQHLAMFECTIVKASFQGTEQLASSTESIVISFPNNATESLDDELTPQNIICSGNDYFFVLEKNKTTHGWEIKQIMRYDNKIKLSQWVKSFFDNDIPLSLLERNYRNIIFDTGQGLLLYGNTTLPQLTAAASFRLNKIESNDDEVTIDYEYEPEDILEREVTPVRSGYITLFKDSWLIKEARFILEFSGERFPCTINCNYIYINDIRTLKRKVIETTRNDITFTSTLDYNNVQYRSIPPSRFTLSHYGLPEPDFGESRPNRIRCILMTLGGILILLAGWQMYQKRRDKREETGL